jgi:hypothetical protein
MSDNTDKPVAMALVRIIDVQIAMSRCMGIVYDLLPRESRQPLFEQMKIMQDKISAAIEALPK